MIRSKMTLEENISVVIRKIEKGLEQNILKATQEWHGGVVNELSGEKSGRLYYVPGTGKVVKVKMKITVRKGKRAGTSYTGTVRKRVGAKLYSASAPGEAPAVRLGQLRQSYRFVVDGVEGLVGSPLSRALWLEKGTDRMAPRPHLEAAYNKREAAIKKHLSKNID